MALALALAMAPPGAAARAEALRPVDSQDLGFARLSLERAPRLVWELELERLDHSSNIAARKEPQRKSDMAGLLLPGDGRVLAAFTGVEPDGRRVNVFRVADGEGRLAGTIPIGVDANLRSFRQRPNGAALAFGGEQSPYTIAEIAPDGALARRLSLATPYPVSFLEAHGDGYFAALNRERTGDAEKTREPFHLLRLDADGRTSWSLEYPRSQYGFSPTALRRDGYTLVVLNSGPLREGIVVPLVALLLDRAGKIVRRTTLSERSPMVPTGLAALRGGGFLLTGFYWGPGENWAAWLDDEGRVRRYDSVEAGHADEWMSPTALGDGGFLAADDKGTLLRFDNQGKLSWRIPRQRGDGKQVWIVELRPLAGGGLLVAVSTSGTEYRPASAGQKDDWVHISRHMLELYRFE